MIVLDQDKVGLVNSDAMLGFSARPNPKGTDYWIVVLIPTKEPVVIGTYETEARAQEVLASIFTEFKAGCRTFEMPEE